MAGFLIGTLVGALANLPINWVAIALALLLIIIFAIFGRLVGIITLLALIGLLTGLVRTDRFEKRFSREPFQSAIGQSTTLTGIVQADPTPQRTTVRFQLKDTSLGGESVDVIAKPYPRVLAGDVITATCVLEVSERHRLTCPLPKISVIEHRQTLGSALAFLRRSFVNALQRVFPQPAGGFIVGTLVGGSASLGQKLIQSFRDTGTSHLVALSGFNISIIAAALLAILSQLGIPRRVRPVLIIGALVLFVMMVGAGASIVRAAIMGVLVVVTKQQGRAPVARNSLLAAAVLMLWFDPTVLLQDLGFQLSFLATIGIIYVSPIIQGWILARGWPEVFGLTEAAVMSISAELVVTPLLLATFDHLSLIAPLVNPIVAPFIPIIMLFGFLGGLAGLIATTLGQIIGFGGWLSATLVLTIIERTAALSFSAVTLSVPPFLVVLYYIFLTIWLVRWHYRSPLT